MPAPNYSAADYLRALQTHLPRGRVWPRDPDAQQTKFLSGFTSVFERLNAAANNLLIDAFPATAVDLLSEWESTLGLPDPCAGESPTLQGRQRQVVARLTSSGGQSIPYFTQYAETLGYAVTVTQFTPFRIGQQGMGAALGTVDWAFTWEINAPPVTVTYFSMGQSGMGEALASWGNGVLVCEMNEIKPAHTILIIANPGLLDSDFVLNQSTLS
ncbi:putative phage tail protein [Caballeronia sp. dw_19]|uniref:YmfQ family protein n=1 Tax=Caballeronia sp. dw_19 TaxID=2719791 RepID=UPI001BCF0443|nr:putative phage tail protein [Caballeronia sp. dw_19]